MLKRCEEPEMRKGMVQVYVQLIRRCVCHILRGGFHEL